MKLDCYAVLGLSPTAEDAVIRAAYLALMRSYHPDKNPSPEAAARVRAITEAYKTIGDPAKRAAYDAARSEHIFEILGYDDDAERPPRTWPKLPAITWPAMPAIPRPSAGMAGGAGALALAVLLAVLMLPRGQADGPGPAQPPAAATGAATEELRSRPRPDPPAAAPVVKASAEPTPIDEAEPEQVAAAAPAPARAAVREESAKADAVQPRRSAPPPPARAAATKPAAVDEKARVATLEGMSTSFYQQSVNLADGAKRSQLQQARDLFVSARNACRTDKCVGDAHASLIRDISEIMRRPRQATP